jgi:DNA processing protein
MAVPGSPLDQRAIGCNLLIRDGATLIQNADDVIEAVGRIDTRMLRQERRAFVPQPPADLGEKERRIIVSLLGPSAAPIDEVVRLSGLPPALVQVALVELELAGRLGRHAGGKVSLAG